MRGSVRGDGNVLNLDLVVIIQPYIFVKTQSDRTIRKNKILCKLYLNKSDLKK